MRNPEYPKFIQKLEKYSQTDHSNKPEIVHALLRTQSDLARAALDAPATEMAYFTPAEGTAVSDFNEVLDRLVALPVQGKWGGCWGPLVGKPNSLVMFIGWDSVEAHVEARKHFTSEALATRAEFYRIGSGVKAKVSHVRFT